MSNSEKPGRINALIRLIGGTIVIIGLLIVYLTYQGAAEAAEYTPIFITIGVITFIVGLMILTVRIK